MDQTIDDMVVSPVAKMDQPDHDAVVLSVQENGDVTMVTLPAVDLLILDEYITCIRELTVLSRHASVIPEDSQPHNDDLDEQGYLVEPFNDSQIVDTSPDNTPVFMNEYSSSEDDFSQVIDAPVVTPDSTHLSVLCHDVDAGHGVPPDTAIKDQVHDNVMLKPPVKVNSIEKNREGADQFPPEEPPSHIPGRTSRDDNLLVMSKKLDNPYGTTRMKGIHGIEVLPSNIIKCEALRPPDKIVMYALCLIDMFSQYLLFVTKMWLNRKTLVYDVSSITQACIMTSQLTTVPFIC